MDFYLRPVRDGFWSQEVAAMACALDCHVDGRKFASTDIHLRPVAQ